MAAAMTPSGSGSGTRLPASSSTTTKLGWPTRFPRRRRLQAGTSLSTRSNDSEFLRSRSRPGIVRPRLISRVHRDLSGKSRSVESLVRALGSEADHRPGALAEVAFLARRRQVVLGRRSTGGERDNVVNVEDDAGRAARATAVAAAEAI